MNSFIKQTIYSLKKEYSLPITIYKIVSSSVDVDSGNITRNIAFRYIKHAILLPKSLTRELFQVEYDINSRLIFIDFDDLKGFVPNIDDYVIYNNRKYLVNEVTTYDLDAAIILKVTESLGSEVDDFFGVASELSIDGESSCSL